MDVRSRAFSTDLRGVDPRPGRAAACGRGCCSWRPATDVARAAVRERAPRAPAAGRRPARRRHRAERELLAGLRDEADLVIDTGDRSVHDLRRAIEAAFAGPASGRARAARHDRLVRVQVRPADGRRPGRRRPVPAQPVLDPGAARARPAGTRRCATTCWGRPTPPTFLDRYTAGAARSSAPATCARASSTSPLAVGCTGGKHRSVVMAQQLADRLAALGVQATVVHRDLGRE